MGVILLLQSAATAQVLTGTRTAGFWAKLTGNYS